MTEQRQRLEGAAFSSTERTLLSILCSGMNPDSVIARAQLTSASWGGYEHADCECFLISVAPANGMPAIEHDGGPLSLAEVAREEITLGLLELWVVDGLLHSVNYMPFGEDHDVLPSPSDYTITLIDAESEERG